MRHLQQDVNIFKNRRKKVMELLKGSALLLVSHPDYIRNHDVSHSYRQDSNFYYLTGFEEPESILLIRPGKDPETCLFVLPKDEASETWDGFRFGPELAQKEFAVDAAYDIEEFHLLAPKMLMDMDQVYTQVFRDDVHDQNIFSIFKTIKGLRGRSGKGVPALKDAYPLLGEMRVFKDEYEIQQMKKAAEVSAYAHEEVRKALRPGVNERALHGIFIKSIMELGSPREAYGGIFATGDNATTLHYVYNDCECKDGDLFLVDAGAEWNYYASDVTRVYPVNGKFTEAQARIYQKVLDVQKSAIDQITPGVIMDDLQDFAIRELVSFMIEEGVLSGSVSSNIDNLNYKKYYPHGLGHWLGLDVHDAGLRAVESRHRQFEPGMVFTVEPGLYFPHKETRLPEAFRGVGVRIEDNILVTEDGCINLTKEIPKEISDLEKG